MDELKRTAATFYEKEKASREAYQAWVATRNERDDARRHLLFLVGERRTTLKLSDVEAIEVKKERQAGGALTRTVLARAIMDWPGEISDRDALLEYIWNCRPAGTEEWTATLATKKLDD
jgi:hypothetical protein